MDQRARNRFAGLWRRWRALAWTNIVFKAISLTGLTPFVGLTLRGLLFITGNDLLTDEDLLFGSRNQFPDHARLSHSRQLLFESVAMKNKLAVIKPKLI